MIAIAFSMMWAAAYTNSSASKHDDACAVALTYFATSHADRASNAPVVYSLRPALVGPTGLFDAQWFANATDAAVPPSEDLRNALFRSNVSAVAECQSVQAFLKVHRIRFGTRAVAAAKREDQSRRSVTTTIRVSLPVLSADRQEAVMAVQTDSGAWSEHLRRKPDGSWQTVANSSGVVF